MMSNIGKVRAEGREVGTKPRAAKALFIHNNRGVAAPAFTLHPSNFTLWHRRLNVSARE